MRNSLAEQFLNFCWSNGTIGGTFANLAAMAKFLVKLLRGTEKVCMEGENPNFKRKIKVYRS